MEARMQEGQPEPMDRRHGEEYRNVGTGERRMSLLAGTGSLMLGLRRGGIAGLILGAVGSMLIYRGATGHCPLYTRMGRSSVRPTDRGVLGGRRQRAEPLHFRTGVTIDRSPEELYRFWRGFTHVPRFMKHIRDVRPGGDGRTHWVAETPVGGTVEWDSEVTEDVPNERIAWRSVEGSDVRQQGEIRFRSAPAGRGTEVELDMRYEPPGGRLAEAAGGFIDSVTEEMAREDLKRFKRLMESGEVPTGAPTVTH